MGRSPDFNTNNQYIKFWLETTVDSQNIPGNYSTMTVGIFVRRTNTGYTTQGNGTWYMTVDGVQHSGPITTAQVITNAGIKLGQITQNVGHSLDGAKILTISARIDHSRFDGAEQGWSEWLPTIPRASVLGDIPSFELDANPNVGVPIYVPLTRYYSGFTNHLNVTLNGTAIYTDNNYTGSTITLSASQLNIVYLLMTSNSMSFSFDVTTYSGGAYIGSSQRWATGILSAQGRAPAFGAAQYTYADINATSTAVTGNNQIIIQGISTARVSINSRATPNKGGVLGDNAYRASAGNVSGTAGNGATPILIDLAGPNASMLTVTATDNRGNATSASKAMSWVDYAAPAYAKMAVQRVNPDLTGVNIRLTLEGTYTNWAGLAQTNRIISAAYRTRIAGGTWGGWTTITMTTNANGQFAYNNTISGTYDGDKSYEVEAQVIDRFVTVIRGGSVGTITPIMDIDGERRRVAINQMLTDDIPDGSLAVAGNVYGRGRNLAPTSLLYYQAGIPPEGQPMSGMPNLSTWIGHEIEIVWGYTGNGNPVVSRFKLEAANKSVELWYFRDYSGGASIWAVSIELTNLASTTWQVAKWSGLSLPSGAVTPFYWFAIREIRAY